MDELRSTKFSQYWAAVDALKPFPSAYVRFDGAIVEIGDAAEFSSEDELALFRKAVRAFIPWKKGPFRLFGVDIDGEWRSDLKWERIRPHCGSLEGLKIADIGSHNGYFMFRMAAEQPGLVVGFEPYEKNWLNFQMMQSYAQVSCLAAERLGVEHIHYYPAFFDKIFCLGILYHHTDPIGILRKIRSALKKGGELLIDCQGIPGTEPLALVPSGRYASARGVWFLPTLPALMNWVRRAGFRSAECIYQAPLNCEEQRSTEFAPVRSLTDFLHPDHPERTIEGYPAPWRYYLKALH